MVKKREDNRYFKKSLIILVILFLILIFYFSSKNFTGNVISEDEEGLIVQEFSNGEESYGFVVETVQHKAVIGQPVKWVKKIDIVDNVNSSVDLVVEVPAIAGDIVVTKTSDEVVNAVDDTVDETSEVIDDAIDEDSNIAGENESNNESIVTSDNEIVNEIDSPVEAIDETNNETVDFTVGITGEVTADFVGENIFSKILKRFGITGRVVSDLEVQEIPIEVTENDNVVEVEYYTDAPTASETELVDGIKTVFVSSPEDVHYTDVLVFTSIPDEFGLKDKSVIVEWVENSTSLDFTLVDTNDDGNYDYIEWVAPRLSNQTFNIILIIDAMHLDENRNYISNIYNETYALDNVWSETITDGHYVRVRFERNLTSSRDITIYPRILSGNPVVNVYEKDENDLIAEFNPLIDNSRNRVILSNLVGEQDTFDLQVLNGDVEFDYITDPDVTSCGVISSAGIYTQTANIVPDGSTASCINVTAQNVSYDCGGFSIVNSSYDGNLFYVNQNNFTLKNCGNLSSNNGPSSGATVKLQNVNNASLSNITLYRCGSSCIELQSGQYNNFTNINLIISANPFVSDGGITVTGSSYNNFTNINSYAGNGIIFSGVSNFNRVRTSLFNGSSSYGVSLSSASNNLIEYVNITNTDQASGIVIGTSFQSENHNVFNNIRIENSTGRGIYFSGGSGNNQILNTTFNNTVVIGTNVSHRSFETTGDSLSFSPTKFIDSYIENYSISGAGSGGTIIVENTQYGMIKFLSTVNGTGTNFSRDIFVGNNNASVRSDLNIGFNRSANVTLYNLPAISGPDYAIIRNSQNCPSTICYNFTSLEGNVTFNVTYWTEYRVSDVIIPNITVNKPANGGVYNASLLFNITLHENGTLLLSLNGGSLNYTTTEVDKNNTYETDFTYLNNSMLAGSHVVNIYATDIAGNSNLTHNVSFTIDTEAPTISFSCEDETPDEGDTMECTCTADDDLDSDPATSFPIPSTVGTGPKTVTCTALDDAGNSATSTLEYRVFAAGGGSGGSSGGGGGGSGGLSAGSYTQQNSGNTSIITFSGGILSRIEVQSSETVVNGTINYDDVVCNNELELDYFCFEASTENINVISTQLIFKVSLEWLINNSLENNEVYLYILNGSNYEQLETDILNVTGDYVYYSATSPVLTNFIIAGVQPPIVSPSPEESNITEDNGKWYNELWSKISENILVASGITLFVILFVVALFLSLRKPKKY